MSLGSVKLKIDVKMTKIQKTVKSKKTWINIYLDIRIDGEPLMNREGVEKIWTLIKRQNKANKRKKSRKYLFYISEEEMRMHPLCCGRGFGYFS